MMVLVFSAMRDFLPRMIVVYILVCVYDMSYEGYAETFEE